MQGKRGNGERVADFVMLMGWYVVRLILKCELFAENKDILGAKQVKVNVGFYASLDAITANH